MSKIIGVGDVERPNILEIVQPFLPCPIAFYSYLNASEDHLLTTPEIDSKLHNIPVVEWPRPRFCIGLAESDMVKECTRGTFDVFDVPLAIRTPELAMLTADNLRFETDRCGRWDVWWWVWIAVTFGITADANHTIFMRQRPRCGRKRQGWSRRTWILVRYKSYGRHRLVLWVPCKSCS